MKEFFDEIEASVNSFQAAGTLDPAQAMSLRAYLEILRQLYEGHVWCSTRFFEKNAESSVAAPEEKSSKYVYTLRFKVDEWKKREVSAEGFDVTPEWIQFYNRDGSVILTYSASLIESIEAKETITSKG